MFIITKKTLNYIRMLFSPPVSPTKLSLEPPAIPPHILIKFLRL